MEMLSNQFASAGRLQGAAKDAQELALLLEARGTGQLSQEVKDAMERLLEVLETPHPWSSRHLCDVAYASAYLVAAILDTAVGVDISSWPHESQGILIDLLGKLDHLGLMETYRRQPGGFGI